MSTTPYRSLFLALAPGAAPIGLLHVVRAPFPGPVTRQGPAPVMVGVRCEGCGVSFDMRARTLAKGDQRSCGMPECVMLLARRRRTGPAYTFRPARPRVQAAPVVVGPARPAAASGPERLARGLSLAMLEKHAANDPVLAAELAYRRA